MPLRSHERCMLVCFSEEADPSCSASTLSNEQYSSLLDAAMRFPDKQVQLLMCLPHDVCSGALNIETCIAANAVTKSPYFGIQFSKEQYQHTTGFL